MPTHDFEPTVYHHSFGAHEAVMRIKDGDQVRTTTIDAGGYDHLDQQVTPGGNPLTGPFWVEGAEPGDTIAVHIDSLKPNRRRGFGRSTLAYGVVDPAYVPELGPRGSITWDVDAEAWTARLVDPAEALPDPVLSLAPMLGCIGVAPDRAQAISSATSGPHGGNMDYRLVRVGTTLYFPVFMPGALLFVGDGHALQGAGEITGTGIEISMEVAFSVRLLKGHAIHWPRGETEDAIFTLGNARPLDQATQHATTEMMRWLRSEYGLSAVGASVIMGHCVDYDLGNVFNPAYTMACRMAKADLATLKPTT